ncbi:AraC family transcriptional regulator [Variovorax sp. 770b2]|uniref:AraC family transcriptional regulator n=1 Tax=Variovorax sp. 770b2 TaxID=1566271 RepID=UPI0008F2D86C|nr:AraC family transcriptional regulator [Variovorax sp. 770b2]SFQ37214.1 AraC-type DNA-binding protein [Variovorax sp. 770b2]
MNSPLLSFEQRIYPAHKLAVLIGMLVENGVPAADALAGSGIAEGKLHVSKTRISYHQMQTVFRNAVRLTSDPALALLAGQRMRVTAYGMYGYALLSSPSHAASVDFAVRHHRVMGPVADMVFSREDDTATYSYRGILSSDAREDLYRFAIEFQFSSHLTLMTDLYGPGFKFSRMKLAYPAPAHSALYKKIFKCPVLFDQRVDELCFDAAWMDEPMRYADPITYAMAREMCELSLSEVNQAGGLATDVRRILVEHPGRFPNIDAMAAELSITPRTLRRRLDAEETSYRQILGDVRMRLAIGYLRETPMTNDEIASRLGYSDGTNFRHAFMRWTQKNPSAFRDS